MSYRSSIRRSARRVARGLTALGVALAAASCAEPIDGANLTPGTRLLDDGVLYWMRVDRLPDANLPDDAVDVVLSGAPPTGREATLTTGDWRELKPVRSPAAAKLFDRPADAEIRRWRVDAPLRLDVARARVALEHRGVEVPKVGPATTAGLIGEHGLAWWDADADVLFSFAAEAGALIAFGVTPPETLRLALEPRENPDLQAFEDRLVGRLDHDDVPGRVVAAELGDVSRRALHLPAGGRVVVPVQSLDGSRLRVAVGLPDVSFDVADGQLVVAHGRSDGARCAIEVRPGPDAEPVRVWETLLTAEDVDTGWIEDVVDLSPWTSAPFELALVTEAGPDDDPWFDHVLWAELRVEGDASERARERPPHVVLIDVDTLRADALGVYGAAFPTSPRLDAWAASRAEVFERMTSTSNWTVPATATMLTGLSVHQHRVNGASGVMTPDVPTIAERLRARGYETRAIAEGACLRPAFGFDVGFEEYRTQPLKRADWREALAWIDERQEHAPLFVFLQTYLVHAPYEESDLFETADAPYDGWLEGADVGYGNVIRPHQRGELELSPSDEEHIRRRYLALVRRADDVVADFLEQLERRLPEPSLVIVTSDHGEEFFEHGAMNHGHTLYEELLRVPLLVKWPQGMAPRREGRTGEDRGVGRVSAPASLVDVVPTILDVVGAPIPPDMPGRSLRGDLPATRVRVAEHAEGVHAIQLGDHKLLRGAIRRYGRTTGERELYDLTTDPGEQHDLLETRGEVAAQLERLLDEYLERWPVLERGSAQAVDDGALIDELKALGYADG